MNENDFVNARKTAAEILQQVLDNRISPEEARNIWPESEDDSSLEMVFHALYHFEDDEDIRLKNKKYSDWQTNQFKTIIKYFKDGKSLDKDIIDWLTPRGK